MQVVVAQIREKQLYSITNHIKNESRVLNVVKRVSLGQIAPKERVMVSRTLATLQHHEDYLHIRQSS